MSWKEVNVLKIYITWIIYIYVEFGVVVIKLRSTRGSNCRSRAELVRLESCNYCLKCWVIWLLLPQSPSICIIVTLIFSQSRRNLYFIFFTNIEKLTYFLMHFLGVLHFFMYFFKFHVFFSNFTHFFQISRICKYVKSRICALGLHYEIREFAYFCPRGLYQKCNFGQFFNFFIYHTDCPRLPPACSEVCWAIDLVAI